MQAEVLKDPHSMLLRKQSILWLKMNLLNQESVTKN